MAYATEAELEALTLRTFDASSKPTTTQVGTLLTEMSNKLDALCHETAGGLGTVEWTTQAVLAGCAYTIEQYSKGEAIDQEKLDNILLKYLPDADAGLTFYHYNDYPNSNGSW